MTADAAYSYTYEHGRQLASMSRGSTTWSFTYDANGMRTSRSDGSRTYNYIYNGSSLSQMTVDGHTLYFTYDASGKPLSVTYDTIPYFYATNLQGDVAAILDSSGNTVVAYAHDAWGNVVSIAGSLSGTLGFYNPLRYRGYVYDAEYGLYYLQSRYYEPLLGRFQSSDAFASTGQGLLGNNMFAYCLNNPVIYSDISGTAARICFGNDTRLNEQPWRDHSPGGGGTNRNIAILSTAQYIFSKTEITVNSSDPDNISIHIQFNTEQTKAHIFMHSKDLNEYVYLLNLEIMKRTGNGLDENNLKQLYGEIDFHIIGWDTRSYHSFDERFRVAEMDIVDGRVKDPRWYVNVVSWFFRGGYDEH